MKTPFLTALAASLLLLQPPGANAQQPGNIDPAYAPAVSDLLPTTLLVQPDGKAIVGGGYQMVNSTAVGSIVRLNTDGTLDSNFATANPAYLPAGHRLTTPTLALQSDGKILVAAYDQASFDVVFVRLNANGTQDTTFTATIDGAPSVIAVQSDGRILIAGSFATLNGVTVQSPIARLNVDGSTDPSFDPGPRPGIASYVFSFAYELALQPDGRILVGGNLFPSYDAGLERLNADGSPDTSFNLIDLPGTTLEGLVLQPDRKIILTYNNSSYNGLAYAARLNADGSRDTAFDPKTSLTSTPLTVALQPDGKLVFVTTSSAVIRLNTDGSPDRDFSFGFPSNSSAVSALAAQPDGNLLVSGTFVLNGLYLNGVARLLGSVPGGASTVTVVVPGTSDTWLARDGATDAYDTVPTQAPVRVADLALTPGATLSFSADGGVDYSGGAPVDPPAGELTTPQAHAAQGGISGITAPLDSLIGVFIDDTAAATATAPADLDFSDPSSREFTTLRPALGQVFYIGKGLTSGGATQQFTIPAGATHLVLGTADGFGWYNNTGAFVVTITPGGITGTGGGGGGSLLVPGTANLWLAGQENGILASHGADQAPAQSPVQVPDLTLDPNKGLYIITDQGSVTTGSGTFPRLADGGGYVTHAKENNVSGTKAPTGSLVGVFLGDGVPSAGSLPGDLDFSSVGLGKSSYSPRLQQVFFIGDGLGAASAVQAFYPPQGATRLFLGVMDDGAFNDNAGSFSVRVSASAIDPTDLRVGENVTSSSTPGGNGSFALVGDVLTYTFTVRNSGKTAFTNVLLHDVLPSYIDLSKTVVSDGGSVGASIVTWSFGTLAPGVTATRTLQVTLANNAPLGIHLINKGYSATADGLPDVAGHDFPDTLIESAVSVKITNNTATGKPGGVVKFVYDLTNTTPEAFKKLTLNVPFLPGLSYHDVYFVDSNGNRLPVDPTGKKVAAYNQQTNSAVFTLNSLKGGAEMFLVLEATVAYNFNPTGLVSLPGAQINISKYTNGQPITLALDDSSSALSGQPADAPPKLVFGKSVVTGDIITILLAANPNSATLLNAITLKPYLDLNPNQKAVQKLGNFTSLTLLTPDQQTQVFNPFVGSDTDADTGASVSTVPAPSATAQAPFVTFALAYSNTGKGKATSVTVYDSVPKGLEIDRDSFFVDGVATPASAIQFNNDGSFAITTKNLKAGKGSLIFYRAKVLNPAPPPNGVDLGGYIEPTSAQLTIENLNDEVIAPAPGKLLLTGPAHASVSSTQTGDTSIGSNVTYTILYRNDGGQTIKDFRVVSPVPPGGAFQSARFLGLDQQTRVPNTAKGEFLAAPVTNATSGLTVFHLGKVKPRGFGLVQVVYQMTSAVLQQSGQALVHQPYATATGGLPVTSGLADHAPLRRQLRHIGTRDTGDTSVGAAAAPNTSRPTNNPNGPHLGMTVACTQTANTGDTLGYTVTVISLGNTNQGTDLPFDPFVTFQVPVPDGTEYAGIIGGNAALPSAPVVAKAQTSSSGKPYITGYFPGLSDGGACFVTVNFRVKAAAGSAIHTSDIVIHDDLSGTTLHSGPVVTSVLSPTDYFNNPRLVLLNTLNAVSTTTFNGTGFQQRVDQINSKSRFTAVINADYLSLENGVLIVPTVGGNIVAQGGGNLVNTNGSNIVAQGGGNIVAQGGGNIVAQGGGNLITIKNIVNGQGQLISQDGNSVSNIFAGIVAQRGGNIVAQGGGNIVAQGGGNLQSVGVGVISNDGGTFAASADKALAISQADLASFGQLSSLSGEVFRSESGNATFTGSGFAAAVAGGGIKIDGLVRGTNDNLILNNTTAVGNVVRGGSGIIGENGSGLIGNAGGTIVGGNSSLVNTNGSN